MFFPGVVQALNGGCHSDNSGEIDKLILLQTYSNDQKTVQVGQTNILKNHND